MKECAVFSVLAESGSSLVETAVVIPVVLIIIFSFFQISALMAVKTVLGHAAYEGARTGAVIHEKKVIQKRVRQLAKTLPRGAGFLDAEPNIDAYVGSAYIRVDVMTEVRLLPLLEQASYAFGKNGKITIRSSSLSRKEPWTGIVAD